MTHAEFTIKTSDGVNLYAQQWLPEGEIRASINLVHGLGEHSGRYSHVATALNNSGFAVSAIDLRGHGKTGGPIGHIPSYDLASEDINLLVNWNHHQFTSTPQFLYGHSLGGVLVLYTCLYHQPSIKGAIVASPGLKPAKVPKLKLLLANILNKTVPTFPLRNSLDINALSHDRSVIDAYTSDPLVHPMISVRLGLELIANGQKVANHKGDFPVPLLLLQGGKDRLVDPHTTRLFAAQLDGTTTFKLFEESYHELHNEPWKDIVMGTIIEWINARI